MSLDGFYESIDGDLVEVRGRLLTDERVTRFVQLFLKDVSYAHLIEAMECGDMAEAFRASHTLKGLAENMGFTALFEAAHDLTEALRPNEEGQPQKPEEAPPLMAATGEAYERIIAAAEANL